MTVKMIRDKLDSYQCQSVQEEDFALREITQELVLNSLYNSGFFKKAAFHGGTALRLLYGVKRFSEDLDFTLFAPDEIFDLNSYLASLNYELKAYGYDVKAEGRGTAAAIKHAFVKDDSLGRLLTVQYPKPDGPKRSLKIKLEVDTNPPLGAVVEAKFLNFPINFSVATHDIPSLFAGKSHALLCRDYVKGRDWFDFLWYSGRRIEPNWEYLTNAINQMGPWQGQGIAVDKAWYRRQMANRIKQIDWRKAKDDVRHFLKPSDVRTLELWTTDFFLGQNLTDW